MKTILHKSRKLLRKIEVDRAVFFGILTKVWSIIAGPLTALLIILKFNPELQGYYYTFSSLLALQVFVELGLGTVIIQFASHEWSKLKLDSQGGITGDRHALSRLASLANITFRWYLIGGLIIAFGLGLGGYIFLKAQASNISWSLPWFALCFFTGISVCLIPVWSLLEGCNQVSVVYTYRFIQGIVTNSIIWIALFFGAKLWTASISVLATILFAVAFLRYKYWKFIKELFFSKPIDAHIEWLREIFPMQWRIALSWISGYFVFSLFTPIIFRYHGAIDAGRFGMTWSLVGVVSAVSGAWLFPKAPKFGILIAKKEYLELDTLFLRITKIFISIMLLSALTFWSAVFFLNKINHPFALRLLPLFPTTVFLIAQVIMMSSLPFSVYLRAHKKEPILYVSLIGALLIGLSTYFFGRYYSITAVAFGYLAVNIIIVPFIGLIWYRCRKSWHSNDHFVGKLSMRNEYIYRKIKEKGIFYGIRKSIKHGLYAVICQLCGIVVYPICRLINLKFIFLSERAIGHLCIELDCYIKEGILGLRKNCKTILLAPAAKVANAHLLSYWESHFKIIRSPWLCFLLEPFARNSLTGYLTYRFAFSENSAHFPEIQKKFNGQPALLSLKEADRQFGLACLRQMGVPDGSWFVCVHCREDGYLGDVNQSLRNADISNYLLAIKAIIKRGGWVMRMGDPSVKPLPAMDKVIDYAHSNMRSEQMDVFLCATCKFFLGSDSGLYHVSSVFGVPAAIANYAHLSGVLPYGPADIGIPKLIWSEKDKRYLAFKEVLGSPSGKYLFDHLFMRAGLRPVENSAEDIRDLAMEMLDRTEGVLQYSGDDELLQKRFKALMNPNHYSFGAISRVGCDFLRKYSLLLEDK